MSRVGASGAVRVGADLAATLATTSSSRPSYLYSRREQVSPMLMFELSTYVTSGSPSTHETDRSRLTLAGRQQRPAVCPDRLGARRRRESKQNLCYIRSKAQLYFRWHDSVSSASASQHQSLTALLRSYGLSKLLAHPHMIELQSRFDARSLPITTMVIHPGGVATGAPPPHLRA